MLKAEVVTTCATTLRLGSAGARAAPTFKMILRTAEVSSSADEARRSGSLASLAAPTLRTSRVTVRIATRSVPGVLIIAIALLSVAS